MITTPVTTAKLAETYFSSLLMAYPVLPSNLKFIIELEGEEFDQWMKDSCAPFLDTSDIHSVEAKIIDLNVKMILINKGFKEKTIKTHSHEQSN